MARETSRRVFARREYAEAPSTPMNAHTVNSIMPWTWVDRLAVWSPAPVPSSPKVARRPQKSAVKTSGWKPTNATMMRNARMGSSFAAVVTMLSSAACRTPRASTPKMTQVITETPMALTSG